MLSAQENELLTRTGPGTPCGELMRRYWQPAALAEELPHGGPPLPVRLLGEDLVLFRDAQGRPGLLGLHCSHRGADLSYGRLEDGGIRCIYHGWLYDVNGRCLEQPGEPEPFPGDRTGADADGSASPLAAAPRRFKERIRHPAYPCQEVGDVIFAYLGPGEPPLLPAYECLTVPPDHRFVTKTLQECNYLQGNEANLDSQHHSFLHRVGTDDEESTRAIQAKDGAPIIEPEETDYGVRLYSIRQVPPDRQFVKITNFVFPNLCAVTGYKHGYSIHWHVPIDDETHWKYYLRFNRAAPFADDEAALTREQGADFKLFRNRSSRYLQDREEMKSRTYAGLGPNNNVHDTWVTESQGAIQDRMQERLGYNERGIVAARQVMLGAIADLQAGREPLHVVRDPGKNHFPHMAARKEIVPASVDWHDYMEETMLNVDSAWAVAR
jgi:phthalate 4,5-dioxygenase oxygenase subunit